MNFSSNTISNFKAWTCITRDRCHLNFELYGNTADEHLENCRILSIQNIERVKSELPQNFYPKNILEVGASIGFNCIALSSIYKSANVTSIEPDAEAVNISKLIAGDLNLNYKPMTGFGEKIPFPDNHFDLIICHTVIEHVDCVKSVIAEMARVLQKDGLIHMEAPNYLWPYEPHLDIWCLPKLGKSFVKFMSLIQGQGSKNSYLEHLKFVTPFILEKHFKLNNLIWHNLMYEKIEKIKKQEVVVKKYTILSKLLQLKQFKFIINIFLYILKKLGLYPSVLYIVRYKS